MCTHTVSFSATTLNASKPLKEVIFPVLSPSSDIFRLLHGTVLLRGGLGTSLLSNLLWSYKELEPFEKLFDTYININTHKFRI